MASGSPYIGQHPEGNDIQRNEGDQTGDAQIQRGLQKFIVGMRDVKFR